MNFGKGKSRSKYDEEYLKVNRIVRKTRKKSKNKRKSVNAKFPRRKRLTRYLGRNIIHGNDELFYHYLETLAEHAVFTKKDVRKECQDRISLMLFRKEHGRENIKCFFRIRNVVMPKPHSVGCRGAKKPFLFFIWATLWAKQKLLVSISRYGLFVAGILFKIKTEKQHGHVPKKTRSLSSLGRAKHTGVLTKAFSILCLKRNIKKE